MEAIRVHVPGDVNALRHEQVELPVPAAGQVRLRVEAIGVNFIEIYQRSGQYVMPLPFIPGSEAAGVVDALGEGVSGLQTGDRVASTSVLGSYAQYTLAPADKLVPIPAGVDARRAAAALLQGMTAHYLSHSSFPIAEGQTVLIHAAAGGVGLWLIQLAKARGARVIGTVSTQEKEQRAREYGADAIIRYTEQDFVSEVRHLTNGRGVDVVYDSVGKQTFDGSLDCLRPRGMLVLFGQSSGAVPPFNPQILNQKGSLFLTRPTLAHYVATADELRWRAADILGGLADGRLRMRIEREFPLSEAGAAQTLLNSRASSGKILLIPG